MRMIFLKLELKIIKCAASIVSIDAALTSKQCVTKHDIPVWRYWVRAGSNVADAGKTYVLRKIITYSDFSMKDEDALNDIAIIFTKKPFKFSHSVETINVPTSEPKDGLKTMVAGWGAPDDVSIISLKCPKPFYNLLIFFRNARKIKYIAVSSTRYSFG